MTRSIDAFLGAADSALRTLDEDVSTLQRQEQDAADLISYLDAKLADGQKLITEYTTKAAEAKAKYGELVQQEADRQMTLRAEKAAKAVEAEQARALAEASTANTTAVPAAAPSDAPAATPSEAPAASMGFSAMRI